jgi:hypothetical protein
VCKLGWLPLTVWIPVRATVGEVGDVFSLAVQRVSGDHAALPIADLVEQRREACDLVGLTVYDLLDGSCPSCCHQHRHFYPDPLKPDTITTSPGP